MAAAIDDRKVVLITGCSSGIGRSLALSFAARPECRVFATARSLEALSTLPASITPLALDVTSSESIASCIALLTIQTRGRIDILVNNAGRGCVGPVIEVDMEQVRGTFEANVFGLIAMCQAVTPFMIDKRSGNILNIGSVVAYVPTPWASVYCASKAAVHSFSDCLRMELAGESLNASVSPFSSQTDWCIL